MTTSYFSSYIDENLQFVKSDYYDKVVDGQTELKTLVANDTFRQQLVNTKSTYKARQNPMSKITEAFGR